MSGLSSAQVKHSGEEYVKNIGAHDRFIGDVCNMKTAAGGEGVDETWSHKTVFSLSIRIPLKQSRTEPQI